MKHIAVIALFTLVASVWADTLYFECQDGYNFTAQLKNRKMRLFLPRERVTLPQVPSASGAKYANKKMTLFTKGDEALFSPDTIGGYLTCKNSTTHVMEERNKTKGDFFKAEGHEPQWQLQLKHHAKSLFLYDDSKLLEFNLPKARQSGDSKLYVYNNHKNTMLIELHRHRCLDSNSGEKYLLMVWIKLDGRSFSGCGSML